MILSAIDVGDRAVPKNGEMILMGASREDRHCEPAPCEAKRKMYRTVALVLCYQVLSQPVTDGHVRELIECCPCPGRDSDGGQDIVRSSQVARAGVLDDCPCRPRSTDSDGAPSIFFPSTVRADEPHMRSIDPKQDSKNLLEPEVALATSMLDTLREATEEEYREALARDAARNAAEPDAVPEESATNVVIVVSPNDSDNDNGYNSDESHVEVSRCIHPLENTALGQMRSSTKTVNDLPETFKFPKLQRPSILHRNPLNGNSIFEASNVEESVLDRNGNSLRFQSNTPTFKLTNPLKSIFENRNDALSYEKPNTNFAKLDESESSFLDGLKLPQLKSQTSLKNEDLTTAPSSVHQQQSEKTNGKTSQLLRHTMLPLNLRNLLKLRDVELIPRNIRNKHFRKPKLDLSEFAIPTLLKRNQKENNHKDISKEETKSASSLENNNDADFKLNRNTFDDCKSDQTKINTLPIPSQIQISITGAENERETNKSVEDLTENTPDCNSVETSEQANTINSQIKEAQSQELASELIEPEANTNFIEKNSNAKDSQNLEVEELLVNEDFDADQDSETESSNKISTLVPLETREKTIDIISQSQENIETSCDEEVDSSRGARDEILSTNVEKSISNENIVSNANGIPPLQETMSNLRENVVKQLENLKKPSENTKMFRMFRNKNNISVGKEPERDIINNGLNCHSMDNLNTKLIDLTDNDTGNNSEAKETETDISISDLQDMSDKLLNSSSNNKNIVKFSKPVERKINTDKVIFKINELNSDISNDRSETAEDDIDTLKYISLDTNSESKEENACLANSENRNIHKGEEKVSKSEGQDTVPKEMDTAASETFINTLPGIWDSLNSNLKLRTPLFEDIVLHPAPDPLNLLTKPLNVLNLNTNLPTLDDVRERLAYIFNTNERSEENYSGSLETDCANDTPRETMAPEASTTKSHKVDIFRNKPSISIPSRSLLSTSKLNLNNFQTKVPVPNSLNLKPVQLESKLGKKAGVDRSIPNFGSDRTSARYAKPRNLFTHPLDNFPTLEDLRYNLRTNNRNLLNRPVDPDLNLFSENLRINDVENIAENIRLNTQKTMKGIQQKMKSTLKKTKLQSPLGDPFAKPQEFLDDMNDKLKAIHYDLNDRISSIHENIIDSSKIKTLADKPRKAVNRNVMTNLRKNKAKPIPTLLQTAASTISTQEIDPNEHNAKQRNFILGSEPRNNPNKDWIKPHKTHTGEESVSTPVIAKSENPLTYLQSTHLTRQNPTMTQILRERKPLLNLYESKRGKTNFEDVKSPIFRTTGSPFSLQRQPNRVTISFGTTTVKPISPPRTVVRDPNISSPRYEEYNPSISSGPNGQPNESVSKLNHKLHSARIPPVTFKPLRTTAPIPSSYDEEFEDNADNFSEPENYTTKSNFKPSILRETPNSDMFRIRDSANRLKSANHFDDKKETKISPGKSLVESSFDWPKVTDNSFLSKVRDALNTRKSSNNHKQVKKMETEQSEMLRSASEDSDIVLYEPLKENVSYKCRMVCTKEIR